MTTSAPSAYATTAQRSCPESEPYRVRKMREMCEMPPKYFGFYVWQESTCFAENEM